MRTRYVRPASLAVFTLLFCLGAGVPAEAAPASGTSELRVHVVLPPPLQSAAPIVSVSPAGVPSATRTIVLAATRLATVAGLDAGTYDITVAVAGGTIAEGRVGVASHEIVTLTASVSPAASRLDVTDRQRIGETTVLDARWLRDLPSTSHLGALIETVAPFAIVDHMDNGGLATARTSFIGARGASFTSTSISVDGLRLADPGRLTLMPVTPPLEALDTVAISYGMTPVDVSAPGAHIMLLPRLPGTARRGSARASFTAPGMVATNALADAPSIARLHSWREATGEIGGPLGANVGARATVSVVRTQQALRDDPRTFPSASTTLFGGMTVRTSPADQLRVTAGGGRLNRPFDGRAQFADDDVRERVGAWHATAAWQRAPSGGSFLSVSGGLQRYSFDPAVTPVAAGGVVERVTDGVVPEPPAEIDATEWSALGEIRPRAWLIAGRHHSLRAGFGWRRTGVNATAVALPVVAETVDGQPARVWMPVAPSQAAARAATHTSFYVEDRVDLSDAITLVAGSRFDLATGSATGAGDDVRWWTMSPRASIRWRLGPLTAFGAVGRYAADLSSFLLAYGDPGAPSTLVHRWTDPNLNGRFEEGEAGVLIARAGPGAPVSSIDPNLRAPRTTEWTTGGDLTLGQHHRLRGLIVIRRERSLVGLVNVGVPPSSYDEVLVLDQNTDWHSPDDDHLITIYSRRPESFGLDELVLTNPDDGTTAHDGIEVTWMFQSARWQMLFGATAYRSIGRGAAAGFGVLDNDQGVVGEQYFNPNASVAEPGRLFFDRAYVGKWALSYRGPAGLRVGAVARYQDGQPFSRVIIADLSTGPEMIQTYEVGRTRFTYTATVDVRVEKGVRVAGRRVAFQLDVFNLTNHRNEVEEDVVTRATFRRSTAVQPPLTARLGFRIDF